MKFLFYLLLIFGIKICHAQENLVPNPSFEDYNKCPDEDGVLTYDTSIYPSVQKWFKISSTPDYFNLCFQVGGNNIFNILANGVKPKSGQGNIGLYTLAYDTSLLHSNIRVYYSMEIVSTILNKSLKLNKKYYVSYFVRANEAKALESQYLYSSYATTSKYINCYLSDTLYQPQNFYGNDSLHAPPNAICMNNSKFISDTVNYTKISGIYTAKGGERFINIGNLQDAYTPKLQLINDTLNPNPIFGGNQSQFYSYYLIDDVSIIDISNFITHTNTNNCANINDTFSTIIPFEKYEWSTGDTTQTIYLNTPEILWCKVTEGCDTHTDTFYSKLVSPPPSKYLGADKLICNNENLQLMAPPNYNYLWSDGSITQNIQVSQANYYSCALSNACGTSIDTVKVSTENCEIFIPNAFTPNADGVNDELKIIANNNISIVNTSVYNRWGQKIFTYDGNSKAWDGYYKGYACTYGTYYYVVQYKLNASNNVQIKNGSVELIK